MWHYCESPGGGGGGGVLGISSDGDDRRIFLGLKLSIPGFFWVRKFGSKLFNENLLSIFDMGPLIDFRLTI